MLNFRLKLRIIWIAALITVILWLVWMNVVPGGKITYIQNFKGYNDFIGNLTPAERLSDGKIIGDPVYFSLRVPRRFVGAKLTLKYKPDPGVSIIEAGVLKDRATWQYDLRPIYNVKLESLLKSWSVVLDGEALLLQREKEFNTVADFIKNPPDSKKIALYNYSFKDNYLLPDYFAAASVQTMCRPITGTYQFYTYLKDEDLSFDFSFQDLNRNADSDQVDVYVYYNDKQIYADHLEDDGILVDTGAQKPWRNLKIFLAGLPEGVYKIGVRANNDIVTRTISTKQSKMAFINKINLASAPEVSCGRDLITDSRRVQAQTVFADKLQTIKISPLFFKDSSPVGGGAGGGGSRGDLMATATLAMTEPFTQFSTQGDLPAMSRLILQDDGVMISGDGLFSFSQEQFIDPAIRKIDANFDADKEGIDYILAEYASPVKDGEWLVSEAEFDLQNVYKQWNKHSFLLSVPGLKAEIGNGEGVIIGEIKVELQGTGVFEKLKKFLRHT